MARSRYIFVAAAALVHAGFQEYNSTDSPHAAAWLCRSDTPSELSSEDCENICALCHGSSTDTLEFYDEGDARICGSCHSDKTTDARLPADLLVTVEHGNHPVGVPYSDSNLRSPLAERPSGPKLFKSPEGPPKIYCSTCHDSHSTRHRLLRGEGEICLLCHLM